MNENNKISNLENERKKKREKTGWTQEEIEKIAKEELKQFEKLSDNEPDNLVSGNMEDLINGDSDDKESDK